MPDPQFLAAIAQKRLIELQGRLRMAQGGWDTR
jgi:hypothetical protein